MKSNPPPAFLSLGKLTARVEMRGEGRGESPKSEVQNPKSKISNPQSPIPNPLFVVRTPTAVITDLGTEFGVEVDRSGATESRVFQGKIEVRPVGGNNPAGHPIQLDAGESARGGALRKAPQWSAEGRLLRASSPAKCFSGCG